MFSKYNEYKTRIRLIDIEIEDSISLGSKSDEPMPGKVTARTNTSVVERQAERIAELSEERRELVRAIQKLDEILDTLPEESRTLLKLKYIDEMSVDDLCERYHVTDSCIYKRLKKAKKLIQKYFRYCPTIGLENVL